MPSTPRESHNQGTGMRAIFLCINQPIDRLTTGRSMNILAHGKEFWHTLPDLIHTHPFHSPRHPTHPPGLGTLPLLRITTRVITTFPLKVGTSLPGQMFDNNPGG
ncbi:hypothetical protein NW754_003765 [Fusarium falciforme]|uniref:Uncharacterized protein n=1 Tax=Fusarium falciforme TaxID=195108 RepID=A0A9W8RED5_9HYPO|nr:hypothetical protein NW754_003765 [Fusarium falciforme]KAJ4192745.1 hypothetical protein NW755_003892 [Fusarium falciforme]KAJ4253022.1 hypothetical protein NW757_005727 [Fusarium falciforme]